MRDYLVCKSYVAVTAASRFSLLLLHLHEHIIAGIRSLPLHHPVMVAGVTSIWSQRCCCYDATTNAPVAAHWSVKHPTHTHTHTRPPPLGYSGFSFLCTQIVSPLPADVQGHHVTGSSMRGVGRWGVKRVQKNQCFAWRDDTFFRQTGSMSRGTLLP